MERHYMKNSFPWAALSERSYGFVVRASAVQYDVTGEPCVFAVTCDGWRSLYDEINAGRAYLYPVRVTVVGEYEPGILLIRSDKLRKWLGWRSGSLLEFWQTLVSIISASHPRN